MHQMRVQDVAAASTSTYSVYAGVDPHMGYPHTAPYAGVVPHIARDEKPLHMHQMRIQDVAALYACSCNQISVMWILGITADAHIAANSCMRKSMSAISYMWIWCMHQIRIQEICCMRICCHFQFPHPGNGFLARTVRAYGKSRSTICGYTA